MPTIKNLSRGCLGNSCEADADVDISKTICRPPTYGGGGGRHNHGIGTDFYTSRQR